MRVTVLCQYPFKRMWGGPAVYIDRLTHHISCIKDVELHVITIGDKGKFFKKGNLNVHVVKISKYLRLPFFIPILTLILRHKILKIDPDIVYAAQGTLPPYSTAAALVRGRYPVVLTVLGIVAKEVEYRTSISYRIWTSFNKPNERYVVSKIPNIIVGAKSIKNLIRTMTKSKIYVVPVGIEFEKMQKIEGHLNEKTDIFFASRLAKIKGIDILIQAASRVINAIPNLSICIAGSGPQENELKSLVKRLNLEDHVKFLGFISEEEKYQYYRACKLVVVSSRWDCQPLTLFETAASGKPVIASDMSNPGIVEDGVTVFVFKSENIKDLANKIILLLQDEKLREEMGRSAKEKAKQYDWSKVAERYVEIYKDVIANFHERKIKNKKEGRIS